MKDNISQMNDNFIFCRNILVGILAVHYADPGRLFTKYSVPFYILTTLVSFMYIKINILILLYYYT